MKKVIKVAIVLILMACQQTVKDSNRKNNKEGILNKNFSVSEIKKQEECVPSGYNPWNIVISHYQMGIPDDLFIFYTQKELRFIRNSIYAEKGYRFKSEDLATFFKSKNWYCPKYDNVDSLVSPMEQDFINTLVKLEKKASNYYEEKEIHEYFIKLFLTKPKIGNNPIPLYFHNTYLHSEGAYRYFACELINETDEYLAFIYNAWGGDDSDGSYYLTVVNKDLKLLENYEIGVYDILSKEKIRVHLTKSNYNPNGDFYDEEEDKRFYLDTIGTKDYLLDTKGKIKIEERLK